MQIIIKNATSNCEAPQVIVDKLQEQINKLSNNLSDKNKVIDSQLIVETYQYIQSIQKDFVNIIIMKKERLKG